MSDTARAVLIFPVGTIVCLLLAWGLWRLAGWLAINAFAALTMRPGRRYTGWRWDVVRRWVMRRDKQECQGCGAHYRLLHVHHVKPVHLGGGYQTWNLRTLCERCHTQEHPHMQRGRR